MRSRTSPPRRAVLVALGLATLLAVPIALAQAPSAPPRPDVPHGAAPAPPPAPPPPPTGHLLHRMQFGLDLDPSQQETLQELFEGFVDTEHATMEAIRAKRDALREGIRAEPFDETAIRATAAELGDLEGDHAVSVAELLGRVREVLTPEQQTAFQQMLDRQPPAPPHPPRPRAPAPRPGNGRPS